MATMEATLTDPVRDPASMMKPSTTYGNDLETTVANKNQECPGTDT